jgi:hypothetical protein
MDFDFDRCLLEVTRMELQVNQTTLSRWLSGAHEPRLSNLQHTSHLYQTQSGDRSYPHFPVGRIHRSNRLATGSVPGLIPHRTGPSETATRRCVASCRNGEPV